MSPNKWIAFIVILANAIILYAGIPVLFTSLAFIPILILNMGLTFYVLFGEE